MTTIEVPETLGWWREEPGGATWLERLPATVSRCAERWGLDLGEPLPGGNVALVLAATREDGSAAVLKVSFPDAESEHEADALELWDGQGAARLLEHDPALRALLVERCRPGRPLLEADDDTACEVVAGLLPRLGVRPPAHFRRLEHEAARWVDELPQTWERSGRPFERTLLNVAVAALAELGPTQARAVVANEDLHAGNVLSAEREPWLVVDPKPVAAEPAFMPVAMVRDRREALLASPRPLVILRRRLDRFSSDLELDRERVRLWTLAHTIAWAFGPGGALPAHVELARLLLDA